MVPHEAEQGAFCDREWSVKGREGRGVAVVVEDTSPLKYMKGDLPETGRVWSGRGLYCVPGSLYLAE